MTYKVPDFAADKTLKAFEFELPGADKVFTVKSFNLLTAAEISSITIAAKKDDLTPMITLLSGGDSECDTLLWNLPIKALTGLYEAWQKQAGISAGE